MKKKTKRNLLWFAGIIVLILGILYVTNLPEVTTNYFETEYGSFKIVSKNYNFIGSLFAYITTPFQQTAYFQQDTADIGESVKIEEKTFYTELDVSNYEAVDKIALNIYRNNNKIETINYDFAKPLKSDWSNTHIYTTWFTPKDYGDYSVNTRYEACKFFSSHSYSVGNGIDCYNFGKTWTDSSGNILVVEEEQICDKDAYWSNWETYNNINGGEVERRYYYNVDSSCNYDKDKTDYRTSCDSGYQIIGTDGQTSASEKTSCEEIYAEDDCNIIGCEGDLRCDMQTGDCFQAECSSDITQECWDGSSIITQYCNNGRLEDSNKQCPDTPDKVLVYNLDKNCDAELVLETEVTENYYEDKNKCESNLPDEGSNIFILIAWIFAIIVVLALIILIIIGIMKKRNKPRR